MQPETTVLVYKEVVGWQQYELVRIYSNAAHVIPPIGKITSFPINVARLYHDQAMKENEIGSWKRLTTRFEKEQKIEPNKENTR